MRSLKVFIFYPSGIRTRI